MSEDPNSEAAMFDDEAKASETSTPDPVASDAASPDDMFEGETEHPRRSGKRSVRTMAVAGVATLAIAAGGFFGVNALSSSTAAQAANGGPGGAARGQGMPGGGGASGTITAISGSTLTVKSQSGASTEVDTSSSTTVSVGTKSSLRAIAVGDTVSVGGTGSATKIKAMQIVDGAVPRADNASRGAPNGAGGGGMPPSGGQGHAPSGTKSGKRPGGSMRRATGTVKSISGSDITLTTSAGKTVTVVTSSSTTVVKVAASEVSALKVGDTVHVMGSTSNGTVTATAITSGEFPIGGPGGGPGGPGGPGGAGGPGGNRGTPPSN